MHAPRPIGSLARVACLAAACALAPVAIAAENFVCGPGGRPNPKTAVCNCPPGKLERTSGGTSRCVEAAPKPTATSNATSNTRPTSTAAPTPTPPLACAPSQFPTARGCVDRCAAGESYRDHVCVPRCRADESWSGSACVKAAPPPGSTAPVCDDLKVLDPTGHCCFPGQTWGEQSGRCRGAPRCPTGTVAEGESCGMQCEEGMQRAGDGVHCCWPGQEWSGATRECIGVASCPEGFELGPDGCHALRLCEPGMLATDAEHCCWPGQHWGVREDGRAGCAGSPSCPAPMVARAEGCFPPAQLRERDDRVDRSASWGAQALTFDLGYAYTFGHDAIRTSAFSIAGSWHASAVPLRIGVGVQFGSWSANASCNPATDPTCNAPDSGRSTTWLASVAFAPLSIPNLASGSTSYLNPFVGLEARYTTYTDNAPTITVPGGTSLALTLGDEIFLKPFVLGFAASIGLVGADARPNAAFLVSVGYAGMTEPDLR